ncbi:MAG: hypothetical protein AB1733_07425 [Thermodesulfobacteriota bacterium]
MDPENRKTLQERLASAHTAADPLAVVKEVALADPSASTELLAPALEAGNNSELSWLIVRALGNLAAEGNVAPIYEVWWSTRHPKLTELLAMEGWIPDFASHVRVVRELEAGSENALMYGGPDIVVPLLKASMDPRLEIRERARLALSHIKNEDAIDCLCSHWTENRSTGLREIIVRQGFVARKPPTARVLSALVTDRSELLVTGGPELVRPLVDACADSDAEISLRAARCLSNLKDQAAVDALIEIWTHHRTPDLDHAVSTAGYVAKKPLMNRVLSSLRNDRLDLLRDEGTDLVHPLVVALDDQNPIIARRAEQLLDEVLERPENKDALCRVLIEHGLPLAQEVAIAHGCVPKEIRYRALFYFLTEQWDQYESLDFDMSFLSELYEHGGKGLRTRIADTARRTGRLELVELVSGARHKRSMGEMTSREWEVTLAILQDRGDWETMWRLARHAPAVWAALALERLAHEGWEPAASHEIEGFRHLQALARNLKEDAPVLGIVDRPSALFTAHGRRVSRLTVSSYFDRTLASASWDGTVRIWSMPDGKLLNSLTAARHPVSGLAASADGSLLITGSGAEGNVRVWSVPETALLKILPGHKKGVASLALGPDGRLLAVGGYDGTLRIWRLRDATLLKEVRASHESVRSVAFSPNGELVATGGEDARIGIWRVPSGDSVANLHGHSMTVRALAFTPDGTLLASGGSDNDVIVWDVGTGELVVRKAGHANLVTSLAISGDGRMLASASWDRTVRMWVLPDGKPMGMLEEHTGPVTCLATDPESRMLISGGHDCTVVMWNFQSGIFRRPTTRPDMERIESLAATPANDNEKNWLDFLMAHMKWRWRYDVELLAEPSSIEIGQFDIEVEG